MSESKKRTAEPVPEKAERSPYQTPKLTEWGSIVEITHGFLQPPADFPFVGGSSPT